MTAPTSPFSTSTQVSYLLQNMFYGGTPNAGSVPSDTVLDQLILLTDGVILTTFGSIGYKVPFTVLSGESWPALQTLMLQYLSMVGTASMATGYILSPVPSRRPPSESRNVFGMMFDKMKTDITNTGLGFRAGYYVGTKAEKILSEPYGPRMDFIEDYTDPTRYSMLKTYTDMILKEIDEVTSLNLDFDYTYDLRSSSTD